MAEAEAVAKRARGPFEDAAAKAVQVLNEGTAQAPTKPSFGDAIRYTWEANKRSLVGTAEATYGLGEFLFKSTAVYGVIDPEGAVEHWTSLAGGLAYGVQHPVEFAKAVVDWETWKNDPFRAMGRLVPDAALAAATGGAGTAAARSATAARRAAKAAEEAADAARTADRLATRQSARRKLDRQGTRRHLPPGPRCQRSGGSLPAAGRRRRAPHHPRSLLGYQTRRTLVPGRRRQQPEDRGIVETEGRNLA